MTPKEKEIALAAIDYAMAEMRDLRRAQIAPSGYEGQGGWDMDLKWQAMIAGAQEARRIITMGR